MRISALKNTLFLVLLFLHSIGSAQLPEVDTAFKEKLAFEKARHFQQMMLNEQQRTPNQADYDVTYYALDLLPDPVASHLSGTAQVVATVAAETLDRVELNFWDGMLITDIHLSNSPGIQLQHDRENDLLSVKLNSILVRNEQFSLIIEYHGRPQDSVYRSFNFDAYNNQPMIWTLSSVFGARAWWPCKDVPSDKPDSMDIRVTVPENLIVASNGSLRQTIRNGSRTTYCWHEKYPIATYLVSLAIYPYEMHYDSYLYNNSADTMAIHFYSFPGNFDEHARINGLVKEMIGCFAGLFGEYPFVDEKYAQADFLWRGGMEHQTCTSYGSWNEALFAHEIAHQWWGDMITCDNFHHIWLNEGFASYSEALWFESAYPPYSASEYQMMYQLYLGPGTVYVEHPEYEDIFHSGLSYVKGSWILHMLRHIVGDEAFFEILKTYNASSETKYGSAVTKNFQDICEQISGMDLEKFFYQWIYEEFFPQYSFSWHSVQNGSGFDINLEIRQDQDNFIFWMPIDVTVSTSAGEFNFVVWDSLASQSFLLTVPSEPIGLELDKNDWILKRMRENFVDPSFDQGILLVNGVLFSSYDEEIRNSYERRAFWGEFPISFWDCFNPPAAGYPSTLPEPLGHGKVPADVLGQYSTVIWVGNDYGGDIGSWQQTSILPYLEAGGNLLLMTRKGAEYVSSELRKYLGIEWVENPNSTIRVCDAVYPGMADMALSGTQSYNSVFAIEPGNTKSTILFEESASFIEPRGLGVWCHPGNGAASRNEGGNFVFISGRPYRYDAGQLHTNVSFILKNFVSESYANEDGQPVEFQLERNYPNPFNSTTTINYHLNQPSNVTIHIYNTRGELVSRLLHDERMSEGFRSVVWNAKNDKGLPVSSGVYIYQLKINGLSDTRKMTLLK